MKPPIRIYFGLLASFLAIGAAQASFLVTPSPTLTSGTCNARPGQGNASYTIGYLLTVGATPLSLTALGVEDDNGYPANGGFGDGLVSSHVVSIWASTNTSTPLGSVTVPAGTSAAYNDGFRYVNLTTALTLAAGGSYYIGAWFTDPVTSNDTFYNPDLAADPTRKFTLDAAVTGSYSSYSTDGAFLSPVCPTSPGNPLGGWAGASAEFTAIPEPGSLLGVGCLVGAGALLRMRRKS